MSPVRVQLWSFAVAVWCIHTRAPDDDAEPVAPPPVGYQNKKVTVGGVHDAYTDGMRQAGTHLGMGLQIGVSMVFFVGLGLLVEEAFACQLRLAPKAAHEGEHVLVQRLRHRVERIRGVHFVHNQLRVQGESS